MALLSEEIDSFTAAAFKPQRRMFGPYNAGERYFFTWDGNLFEVDRFSICDIMSGQLVTRLTLARVNGESMQSLYHDYDNAQHLKELCHDFIMRYGADIKFAIRRRMSDEETLRAIDELP